MEQRFYFLCKNDNTLLFSSIQIEPFSLQMLLAIFCGLTLCLYKETIDLSVKPKRPSVTGTAVVEDGATTILTCTSSNTLPSDGVSYVWKRNGVVVNGATDSTYTTPAVTLSNNEDRYTCSLTINDVASEDSTTGVTLTGRFISLHLVCCRHLVRFKLKVQTLIKAF